MFNMDQGCNTIVIKYCLLSKSRLFVSKDLVIYIEIYKSLLNQFGFIRVEDNII